MNIDHDKIAALLREVAADKITPRFQKLTDEEIRTKSGPEDLVTIADEEAETELTRRLQDLLPGSLVLGEEAVAHGSVRHDILKNNDTPVWVVDPVDGTRNFARGTPQFGTILALVHKGECVAGWIYQIPRDRVISTKKGEGITIDGKTFIPPSKLANDTAFKDISSFVSTCFLPPDLQPTVEARTKQLADASTYMCCAWEYPALLSG